MFKTKQRQNKWVVNVEEIDELDNKSKIRHIIDEELNKITKKLISYHRPYFEKELKGDKFEGYAINRSFQSRRGNIIENIIKRIFVIQGWKCPVFIAAQDISQEEMDKYLVANHKNPNKQKKQKILTRYDTDEIEKLIKPRRSGYKTKQEINAYIDYCINLDLSKVKRGEIRMVPIDLAIIKGKVKKGIELKSGGNTDTGKTANMVMKDILLPNILLQSTPLLGVFYIDDIKNKLKVYSYLPKGMVLIQEEWYRNFLPNDIDVEWFMKYFTKKHTEVFNSCNYEAPKG